MDVLLIGRLSKRMYPLRTRMAEEVIPALQKLGFNAQVWKHPGYNLHDADTNKYAKLYAQKIASAKIILFCSGTPRTRYAKYTEVAFCKSAICADVPDEDQDFFKEFVIEVSNEMTTQELIKTITCALKKKDYLNDVTQKGSHLSKHLTTNYYAKTAVSTFSSLLNK